MYATVRSEMELGARIAALAHQLSDANLAAMPEFHQRIAVLRQLECAPAARRSMPGTVPDLAPTARGSYVTVTLAARRLGSRPACEAMSQRLEAH